MSETPDFLHTNGPDGQPTHIACAKCAANWVVSPEDPDSTLSDALEHAMTTHSNQGPAYTFQERTR